VLLQMPFIVTASAIVSWAALSVVSRILMLRYGLDPWLFSFVQLCAGGIALLLMSGKEMVSIKSFQSPMTWLLGILRVLSAAIYTTVLTLVSVLEAGLLGAVSIPLIGIAIWIMSGKQPARWEWIGHLGILISIAILTINLSGDIRLPVFWLMVANAISLVALTILAERHPDNVSDVPKVRLRFTGSVLLITAVFFLIFRLFQNGLSIGSLDWTLLISGISVGVALRAPAMILAFWSIRIIGAHGYTTAIVFLPVVGMTFEQIAYKFELVEVSRFQSETLLLATGVIFSTFIVLFTRERAKREKIEISLPI